MAISQISDQNLGKFLQIVFSDGVRNQISEDYRDWEQVQRMRQGDANGRSHRFFFQNSFGPAAIQWAGITPAGSYPGASQISVQENEAFFKEINATIEIEYNLWNRAKKSPAKYAEPLALEISSKATAAKRRMSADLYGSGDGVVFVVDGTPTIVAGQLVVPVDEATEALGFIGFAEYGDHLDALEPDATATTGPTVSSGTFSFYQIEDKDRAAGTVTISARDSSGTELTITTAGLKDNDTMYRTGQSTRVDTTSITEDYNVITEVMAGLESLTANDGRTIHGITMSGQSKGSRYDAGGNSLDVTHIQRALSQTKVAVGEGAYNWRQLLMAPESNDMLIESRETDRRFQTIEDSKRGLKKFAYVHGNDTLEVVTSEYCPMTRVYMMPEAKTGKKVLEFWGSDFESVKPGGAGSEFFLRPNASGHDRVIRSYLESICLLICKHPASIAVIENFSVDK